MYERFGKEKIDLALKFVEFTKKQERSQIDAKRWERERDGIDGYYYDANILLWRFKMAQIWNRHTDNSFLDLLRLEHAQATHEHTDTALTLARTQKFAPPLWYKGERGRGWWNPFLEFLICCSVSKRFILQWKALWSSQQDKIYFWNSRHQQWSPSWPPSYILPRIRTQVKTERNDNFLWLTWELTHK